MAAPRVFVSHASADAAFANHLADDLRRLGADVWLDSSHMGAGDFVGHINAALAGRDTVILIMTPASIQSQWVNREVNAAIARENQGLMRPLIVVMAQPCDPREIPPLWTTYHRYDASRDFSGAVLGVTKELGLALPKPPPPDPQPSTSSGEPKSRPAPSKPQDAQWGMPFTPSRFAVAVLAVLATAILCVSLLDNRPYYAWIRSSDAATGVLLVIPVLLVSQAIGFWALWGSLQTMWQRIWRKPTHVWLAGGFAVVEVLLLLVILLLHQIDALDTSAAESPAWLNNTTGGLFLGMLGLFLMLLISACAVAGMMRQRDWISWLLAPFAALAFILYVLNYDYGAENLRLASVYLLYGLPATWLFIALSFAMFSPVRKG